MEVVSRGGKLAGALYGCGAHHFTLISHQQHDGGEIVRSTLFCQGVDGCGAHLCCLVLQGAAQGAAGLCGSHRTQRPGRTPAASGRALLQALGEYICCLPPDLCQHLERLALDILVLMVIHNIDQYRYCTLLLDPAQRPDGLQLNTPPAVPVIIHLQPCGTFRRNLKQHIAGLFSTERAKCAGHCGADLPAGLMLQGFDQRGDGPAAANSAQCFSSIDADINVFIAQPCNQRIYRRIATKHPQGLGSIAAIGLISGLQ